MVNVADIRLFTIINMLNKSRFWIGNKEYEIYIPSSYFYMQHKSNITSWPDSQSYTVRFWCFRRHWLWQFLPPKRFYATIFIEDIRKFDDNSYPMVSRVFSNNCLDIKFASLGEKTLSEI